jgi:O-antigen ligase
MKAERYFILLILGTVPLIFASVQPWIWSLYVAAVFVIFLTAWWRGQVAFRDNGTAAAWLVYLFFGWSLFQLAPLPADLLGRLSPFRGSLLENAYEMIGISGSWKPMAYEHGLALGRWSIWLAAFLLAMLVRAACREGAFLRALAVVLLVVAGLEALYGLVQALVPSTGVLGYDRTGLGDARGTFINRNHFAGMIGMIWPLCLGYLLSLSPWEEKPKLKDLINSDRFNRQLLISLVLVVMLLALIFSRSRAGITGGVVGFIAFMGATAFSGAGMRKGFWAGMGGALFLLLVYGGQMGFESVIGRFMEIDQGIGRLDKWRDAWLIIQQHSLGVGAGNYQILEPLFQTHAKSIALSVHTHNDYLQLLVETGWPGFVLLTGGWVYLLVRGLAGLRRLFRARGYSTSFFMGVGAWSGLVSMGFHSFFDFNLQIPANLFYFAMLVGILNHGPGNLLAQRHVN